MKAHKVLSIVLSLILAIAVGKVSGQTDDLMIVEFIDSDANNGGAIKIYNPTSDTIDLSLYETEVIGNGSSVPLNTTLTGRLVPGGSYIAYYGSYTQSGNNCPPGNRVIQSWTWDGNDHVSIKKSGSYVDMIHNPTTGIFPTVAGVPFGLF